MTVVIAVVGPNQIELHLMKITSNKNQKYFFVAVKMSYVKPWCIVAAAVLIFVIFFFFPFFSRFDLCPLSCKLHPVEPCYWGSIKLQL